MKMVHVHGHVTGDDKNTLLLKAERWSCSY